MDEGDPAGAVLVAVEDPAHVQQLVRTAGDIARLGTRQVRLVTVVVKPRESPFGVFSDETIVRQFAGGSHELLERASPPEDVAVERDVVVSGSVSEGILAAVEETDPAALVVGWHGRNRQGDTVLGTTIDRLVERAPCDLYVERVGREANGVESVLLPVAGGPHARPAAAVAKAIAVRNSARVLLLTVVPSDEENDEAATYLAEAREALEAVPGPEPPVGTVVSETGDVTDAIVAEATDHDVVVMGATRQGSLRRRLVGSVPRRVVDRTDRTVILARDGEVVRTPLARLEGLLRR
jgi:nucleotide-binding universal stress UspA family protein